MHQHRGIRLIALLIGIALISGATALPASAASSTGGVAGVVKLQGKPLGALTVELTRTEDDGDVYDTIKRTTTNSKGAYRFSTFPVADWYGYRILVRDPAGKIVSTVRDFRAKPGRTATRNVTVKAAGSLTGKLTRADGKAPTTTRVLLSGPDVEIGTPDSFELAYDDDRGVSANGTYRFVGLPAGDYTVRYSDTSGTYLDQCYDDVLAVQGSEPSCDPYDAPQATKAKVSSGATLTIDDQQLHHPGAHLRGTVTDTFGRPIKGIDITPTPTGTSDNAYYDYLARSRSTGRFARGPLEPGSYQLNIEDIDNVWAPQWFDGQGHAKGQVFELSPGETVKDIAVKLKSRAALKVTATPHVKWAAFDVTVTRKASGGKPSGTVTATLGSVSGSAKLSKGKATIKLKGIPSGKRTVKIRYGGAGSTAPATKAVVVTVK